MRKAVFPGSFDPVTLGHYAIVQRASSLFDEIIVALGVNTTKTGYFSLEQRMEFLESSFAHLPNVRVETYKGLTVEFAQKVGAQYLLRGLRNSADFGYERNIAHMNGTLAPKVESVFLLTEPEYAAINARIVREIHKSNGDIRMFVPEEIHALL